MLIFRHWAIMVYSERLLTIIDLMKREDHHTKKLLRYGSGHIKCVDGRTAPKRFSSGDNKLGRGPQGDANTKYQSFRPYGFRQEDFFHGFPNISPCKTRDSWCRAISDDFRQKYFSCVFLYKLLYTM